MCEQLEELREEARRYATEYREALDHLWRASRSFTGRRAARSAAHAVGRRNAAERAVSEHIRQHACQARVSGA